MHRVSATLAVVVVALALLACKDKKESPRSSAATSAPASASYAVGAAVDVQWNGDWWQGTIVSVLPGNQYKIHYVGWGPEWDEVVGPSRLRARTATSRTK